MYQVFDAVTKKSQKADLLQLRKHVSNRNNSKTNWNILIDQPIVVMRVWAWSLMIWRNKSNSFINSIVTVIVGAVAVIVVFVE